MLKHERIAIHTSMVLLLLAGLADAQTIQPLQVDRRTPVVRVFQAAKDAVVNISTTRLVSSSASFLGTDDDALNEVFQTPFDRKVPVTSLGSGFLIHPQGYIVTNEHVVRRAEKVTVSFDDGVTHNAEVISTDPEHDLAILKMTPPEGKLLPALPIGRSDDLMIGETVVAIGNPLGYQHTVTSGVISALKRDLQFSRGVKYTGLIQTDASVNPGNSGGPLLNVNAQVIGINSAIRPDAQGICFAIPIAALADDLPRLLDFRRINRVIIGMDIQQQRQGEQTLLVVHKVDPAGPAASAGVKVGEIITELDGQPLATPADYYVHMLSKRPGEDSVLVSHAPSGTPARHTIRLALRPRPDGKKLASQWFGLTVEPLTAETAERLRLRTDRGLLITAIAKDSPAEQLGLKMRDVIFQLGQSYVADADDLGRVLEDVEAGQTMRVGIVRGPYRAWGEIHTKALSNPAETQARNEGSHP